MVARLADAFACSICHAPLSAGQRACHEHEPAMHRLLRGTLTQRRNGELDAADALAATVWPRDEVRRALLAASLPRPRAADAVPARPAVKSGRGHAATPAPALGRAVAPGSRHRHRSRKEQRVAFKDTDLLTVREAAEICRCSEDTIRRACRDRKLAWFRLRDGGQMRIPAFSLEKLIGPELLRVAETATAATSERVS
jgi:excisionase family DNA binding protein